MTTDGMHQGGGAGGELGGPVGQAQRIVSIDVLRGFALLGILVMNITAFSGPFAAYLNPRALDESANDYSVWLIFHLFADTKMMTIFTLLFGAGIVLMTRRAEARIGRSAGRHYARMGWLLLFGTMHMVLLWFGDILMMYAICGMIVYLFRRLSIRWLFVIGFVLIALTSMVLVLFGLTYSYWPDDARADISVMWRPTAAQIAAETALYAQGPYREMVLARGEQAAWKPMFAFVFGFGYRTVGLMLIGMAMYKLGVFHATRSMRTYVRMIIGGFGIGLPIILAGVAAQDYNNWTTRFGFFFGMQFNYWGGLAVATGWIGVVMLACQLQVLAFLQRALAAVGQMALTNYLLDTIVCTTLFYSYGFGWFGSMSRTEVYVVVAVIWCAQLVGSPLWLRYFRFGPAEWLWRALTYWTLPTFRRRSVGPATA
jgi:uncharacterized protein